MSKIIGSIAMVGVFLIALGGASAGDDGAKKKKGGKGAGLLGKGNVEEMFKKLDADSNGKLSREEFLKITEKIGDADKADKAKQFMGKLFDRIAVDGQITLEQLKKAGENLKKKKKSDE